MNFSSRRLFPEANFDFNFSRYRVPINAKEYSALILKIYYVSTPQLDSPIILLVAGGLFLYSTLAFLPFSLFVSFSSFFLSFSLDCQLTYAYCSVCNHLYTLSTNHSERVVWVILFWHWFLGLLCVWNVLTLIITISVNFPRHYLQDATHQRGWDGPIPALHQQDSKSKQYTVLLRTSQLFEKIPPI